MEGGLPGLIAAIAEILGWACLLAGAFFCLVGGIGLLRMPDTFTRMHAAGVTDTMGAGLILVGLALHEGFTLVTVKLALILLFIVFSSPTATHALAQAALAGGLTSWRKGEPRDSAIYSTGPGPSDAEKAAGREDPPSKA
ncbi:MAG: monovalent cation/H(+) antiporter subunit G [Rhodospirillaceae bacterium]|jgi:multicomponent Na+:H+ antiporter subunit G|nr:monovalent cation/H(+) antiporter subunit G [Rhodospirillaceae bacterium]MBT6119441.1 monovalent cation/H(+) antiporter subunit G [Rhodospirillaceae bacterium]